MINEKGTGEFIVRELRFTEYHSSVSLNTAQRLREKKEKKILTL